MVKKTKTFALGEFVFAKVKGYPPWPAKISEMDKRKYKVYFYGTGETANVKIEDLFAYVASKAKLVTEKLLQRPHFRVAVEQIEAAIGGEDSAPIDLPSLQYDTSVVDESIDQDAMDTTANDTTVNESTVNESTINNSTVAGTEDESEGELVIDESSKSKKKPTEIKSAKPKAIADVTPKAKPAAIAAIAATSTPAAVDAAVASDAEITTSRSGRKIKPKRYLHEELEQEPVVTPKRKAPGPAEVKPAKIIKVEPNLEPVEPEIPAQIEVAVIKSEITDKRPKKPVEVKVEEEEAEDFGPLPNVSSSDLLNVEANKNLLLVITPEGKCVGIKYDQKKPKHFYNEEQMLEWQKNATLKAMELKTLIESGTKSIEDVADMIELNPPATAEQILEVQKEKDEYGAKFDKIKFLRIEHIMVGLDQGIKSTVQLSHADPDKCVKLLKEYRKLNMTPLMLKKNPSCVDTVKRLRRYVGNTKSWKYTDEEKKIFNDKAVSVREHAEETFIKLKSVFGIFDDKLFQEHFNAEVKKFKTATAGMSLTELASMHVDPVTETSPETTHAPTLDVPQTAQPESVVPQAVAQPEVPAENPTSEAQQESSLIDTNPIQSDDTALVTEASTTLNSTTDDEKAAVELNNSTSSSKNNSIIQSDDNIEPATAAAAE